MANEIECLTWASLKRTLENVEGITIECDTTDGDDYEWWGCQIAIKEVGEGYECDVRDYGRNGKSYKKTLKNTNALIRFMKKLGKEWGFELEYWKIYAKPIDLKDDDEWQMMFELAHTKKHICDSCRCVFEGNGECPGCGGSAVKW